MPIVLGGLSDWADSRIVDLFLTAIFKDEVFRKEAKQSIEQTGFQIRQASDLIKVLHMLFQNSIGWEKSKLNLNLVNQAQLLANFEQTVHESMDAYNPATKLNPQAVHWPNPTRDSSQSLYDCVPVIRNYGWINSRTSVASAGSCFASEIAFALQKRGFNYLVAEKPNRPEDGVFSEDFDPQTKMPGASANWGILFNTPSFRQVAEFAFAGRDLPDILLTSKREGHGLFMSPFRENIYFRDPESFVRDQEKHRAAVRQVLSEAEVFIMTPGLNECWEYLVDGSVISRNPRNSLINSLVKHRVLTVKENVENLQRFIDLVRQQNSKIKFILSVSPVPFLATGRARDCHVVQANAHSKAVLRVALEEVANSNDNVVYFPSYEVITNCTKDAYDPDLRHVSRHGVSRVMQTFEKMFVLN